MDERLVPDIPQFTLVLMTEIQPTNEHPVPTSLSEQVGQSLQENVRIAAMTSTIMTELGMPFEMTEEDDEEARKLFAQFDKKQRRMERIRRSRIHRLSIRVT